MKKQVLIQNLIRKFYEGKEIRSKMDSSSEEDELALLGFFLVDEEKRKKVRKHRFWVRQILVERDRQGVFNNLLRELQFGDREYFFK